MRLDHPTGMHDDGRDKGSTYEWFLNDTHRVLRSAYPGKTPEEQAVQIQEDIRTALGSEGLGHCITVKYAAATYNHEGRTEKPARFLLKFDLP